MAERIPQSVALRVPLQAYLSSDHITPATGKTIAITISKNGAAYGNPSGGATNATEIGSGSYYVDLSTTDTGTTGPVFVKGTNVDIDNVIAIYNVVNANTGGLAALPNAAAGANTGLPVVGSQIPNATAGAANGLFIAGTNAATTVTTSFTTTFTGNLTGSVASVVGAVGSVTGAVGSVTSNVNANLVSIANAPVAVDTGTAGTISFLSGEYVAVQGGTFNANVTQWNGENVTQSADGIPIVSMLNYYDEDLDLYQYLSTLFKTGITESYAADGTSFTPAQALYMIWSFLSEKSGSGTTITAKKLDGSTTSMTFTLDSGTSPTSITRAS